MTYQWHYMARVQALSVCAVLAIAVGCGGHEAQPGAAATSIAPVSSALLTAPRWVRSYCDSVKRVVGAGVGCPTALPPRFVPTENLSRSRPLRGSYVFEGTADDHWVFAAFFGRDVRWFRRYAGGFRIIGKDHVHGRQAWIVAMTSAPGIFASHLAAIWKERGVLYICSKHISADRRRTQVASVLAVARRFA